MLCATRGRRAMAAIASWLRHGRAVAEKQLAQPQWRVFARQAHAPNSLRHGRQLVRSPFMASCFRWHQCTCDSSGMASSLQCKQQARARNSRSGLRTGDFQAPTAPPTISSSPSSPRVHARGFLPGLSAPTSSASRHRNYKQQKIVAFPQETIFNVVAAVDQYVDFLPWCLSSQIIKREAADDGTERLSTEIGVGFKMLQSSFRSSVTLQPLSRIHAVSEPNAYLEDLSFTWSFHAVGGSTCRMDLELDFTLKSNEHVLLWDMTKDRVISEYLLCFQRRCSQMQATRAATKQAAPGASGNPIS